MSIRKICFDVDELDAAAINKAIAVHQRRDHEAFGSHILPEGESDTAGATLAEICRDWLERRGEWDGIEVGER